MSIMGAGTGGVCGVANATCQFGVANNRRVVCLHRGHDS